MKSFLCVREFIKSVYGLLKKFQGFFKESNGDWSGLYVIVFCSHASQIHK